MDEDDYARLIGLGVAAAVLWGAWWWLSSNWSRIARTVASWWGSWWPAIAIVVAGLVVLLVVGAWARRRRRHRAAQWSSLAEELGRVMPADWEAKAGLWVRRWRGTSPRVVHIKLSLSTEAGAAEWRRQIHKLLMSRIGPLSVEWPGDDHRSRRKARWIKAQHRAEKTDAGQDASGSVTAEKVEGLVAGLVPSPKVSVDDQGSIDIRFGETTRDQSEIWRGRVVEQVSARTGVRYRAVWHRDERRVQLTPVPELPPVIEWAAAVARFRELGLGEQYVPYGIDEDGNWVAWKVGPQAPHSIGAGTTGSGKTELTKAVIQAWLLMGGLVAIIDPKRQDFAEFRGRPGVMAVATTLEDRLALLEALRAEMMRRNAAAELRKLMADNPHLAGDIPPVSAEQLQLDQVRVLIVIDELTQHRKEAEAWVRALSKEEKALRADVLGIPGEFAQLARAVSMHLWVSMQRGDAGNFGDSTQMRDNLPHVNSMGQLSAIGSEMAWGDRSTGSNVVIGGSGEGMSNGQRISPDGELLQMGVPGRFKAFYSARDARDPALWEQVAAVVPDATRIDLGAVSGAARDVRAAIEALRVQAYAAADGAADDVDASATDPLVTHDVSTHGSSAAPLIPPVSPPTAPVDDRRLETDRAGHTWEQVGIADLEVGDVVSLADLVAVEVVHVAGWHVDDFDGERVFGLTVQDAGVQRDLDLSDDEAVQRLT